MTRINCVPVKELNRLHLIAEYRELPRIFSAVEKAIMKGTMPKHDMNAPYILGKGHMKFFYTRLKYLANRHADLVKEMIERQYNPFHRENLFITFSHINFVYWNDWQPNAADMAVNRERIALRLSN